MEIRWRLQEDPYGQAVDWQTLGHGDMPSTRGDVMERAIGFAAGLLVMSLTAQGSASADEPLGAPMVATTFGLGAGPMPDVATDRPRTGRT